MYPRSRKNHVRLFIVFGLLLLVGIAAAGLYARSMRTPETKESAPPANDVVVVAWVNDRPIYRATLTALANTIHETQGSGAEVAYQAAFNLLVQNTLIHELAEEQGLSTSDAEVDERVESLLREARENEPLRKIYQEQAAAMGLTWESPAFADFLRQQWREALPVEKFHRQLLESAQGNAEQLRQTKIILLTEALSSAAIRLEEEALPQEAKKLHVPTVQELPEVMGMK